MMRLSIQPVCVRVLEHCIDVGGADHMLDFVVFERHKKSRLGIITALLIQ